MKSQPRDWAGGLTVFFNIQLIILLLTVLSYGYEDETRLLAFHQSFCFSEKNIL